MFDVERFDEISDDLAGRARVLVVTKYSDVGDVKIAVDAGVKLIGENRVQDAIRKFGELEEMGVDLGGIEKHLIGHLQRNKVKKAVGVFDCIQSVDSLELVEVINDRAGEIEKVMDVCLQVNVAGDDDKHGIAVDEVFEVAERVCALPSLSLVGVMTIGRLGASDLERREEFLRLKKIFEEIRPRNLFETEEPILSMGMSGDYELAVECGATMVRLGSILFK